MLLRLRWLRLRLRLLLRLRLRLRLRLGVRQLTDEAADRDLGEHAGEHEDESDDTGEHEATTGFGDVGLSGDASLGAAPPAATADALSGGCAPASSCVDDDMSTDEDLAGWLLSVMEVAVSGGSALGARVRQC